MLSLLLKQQWYWNQYAFKKKHNRTDYNLKVFSNCYVQCLRVTNLATKGLNATGEIDTYYIVNLSVTRFYERRL